MATLLRSPLRGKWQLTEYEERAEADPSDTVAHAMIDYYQHESALKLEREQDPEWQQNNLEYDLRTSDAIAEKCKNDDYAQHLYAAMCNNDFMKNAVIPILTEQTWGCSWRYAGGIVADIQQQGDYIDWYCSGIQDEKPEHPEFLSEGTVTEEIRQDLFDLGWLVVDGNDKYK